MRIGKHGLNPTIPICFWCGEQKNEIAIMGYIAGDKEAPMRTVLDYYPCDKCKEGMSLGITFIEVSTIAPPDNRPPLYKGGTYPTGRFWVLTEESVKRMITEPVLSQALEHRRLLIHKTDAANLFGGVQ
jgi:hypothetical protein